MCKGKGLSHENKHFFFGKFRSGVRFESVHLRCCLKTQALNSKWPFSWITWKGHEKRWKCVHTLDGVTPTRVHGTQRLAGRPVNYASLTTHLHLGLAGCLLVQRAFIWALHGVATTTDLPQENKWGSCIGITSSMTCNVHLDGLERRRKRAVNAWKT